jgi:transcriptional regulatory protein RtcR
MATLATGGRITVDGVREEAKRMEEAWKAAEEPSLHDELLAEILPAAALDGIDRFDRAQLAEVIRTCREARSLAAAGRSLFAASRSRRSSFNDSDRLRKYLARFNLEFTALSPGARTPA